MMLDPVPVLAAACGLYGVETKSTLWARYLVASSHTWYWCGVDGKLIVT